MAVYHKQLNACGLSCPQPVLRAMKMLEKMSSGDVLRVIATDPGSVVDFAALARQSGHELLESRAADGKYYYLLKKG
jgi:tRNA 2-thiouridine synthesizing protein A